MAKDLESILYKILRGKYVLATGYSLKAQSSSSSGLCDIVVGLLVDVS